jgi:hypothetical protein
MGEPIAQDAFCTCGHRERFHVYKYHYYSIAESSRPQSVNIGGCEMAGCPCGQFDLAPVKAEWVEEPPTPTATLTAHGHSHKRMTLVVKYDTDRRFPVYVWLKDGQPCEGC